MTRALGRYELLRPLARGGMAEVYLARRRAAGIEKWLVVKRMRPERSGDPRFLDLFVREARLSMSLVHQNIVPVFDFGRIDDQVFLAMERVEGKDLGSSLARAANHRLPPLLAAFIAAECCQALDYAHQRKSPDGVALGVVHRDVTPRNVLLSWSGEVKLTDFGIAALAGDATSRLLGTPQYMAPEQARSEPIDPRTDIYAIGLVLREAVSGVRPRPGTDRDSILDAARRGVLVPWSRSPTEPDAELALGSGDQGEPPEPPEPVEDPPPTLVAIIDRATAVAAADRYPDARTMLEDLDAFIVAERAARKAESPARQLAAWLSAVWVGARDDIETDATIDGDHLVSFLDDGALDVLGTGTVRSMAATAAEELQLEAHTRPAEAPEVDAEAAAASAPKPAPGGAGSIWRASRVTSSTSTVASGSFHSIPTLPASSDVGRTLRARASKQRRAAPLVAVVLALIAVGTAALWIASLRGNSRSRIAEQPSTAQPVTAQPTTGQPSTGQPNIGQPITGQLPTGQPNTGQPFTGQLPTGQPTTGQLATGQSATGQPATGLPNTGQSSTGQSSTGQPNVGHTGRPDPEHPSSGQPGPGHPRSGRSGSEHTSPQESGGAKPAPPSHGSGSGADAGDRATGSSGSDRPRPATCKVRINLTPWAYYTADDDSTRHETPGTIDLTPGPHRLHVWNPELHVERDIVVNVPADRDTMNYSEPLQPTSLPSDANPR